MTSVPPEEVVRRMFEARAEGDLAAALALTDPDMEAVSIADGITYRGRDQIRRYLGPERDGLRVETHAFRFVPEGEDVIAYGRIRVVGGGSMSDSPAVWRCSVRNGLITRIVPLTHSVDGQAAAVA